MRSVRNLRSYTPRWLTDAAHATYSEVDPIRLGGRSEAAGVFAAAASLTDAARATYSGMAPIPLGVRGEAAGVFAAAASLTNAARATYSEVATIRLGVRGEAVGVFAAAAGLTDAARATYSEAAPIRLGVSGEAAGVVRRLGAGCGVVALYFIANRFSGTCRRSAPVIWSGRFILPTGPSDSATQWNTASGVCAVRMRSDHSSSVSASAS